MENTKPWMMWYCFSCGVRGSTLIDEDVDMWEGQGLISADHHKASRGVCDFRNVRLLPFLEKVSPVELAAIMALPEAVPLSDSVDTN